MYYNYKGRVCKDEDSRARFRVCFKEHALAAARPGRQAFAHPGAWEKLALKWPEQNRASWINAFASEGVARAVRWPQRLLERLLLTMVGDGARVGPLLSLWLAFFLFSWLIVFSDAASVERPATFVVPPDYSNVRPTSIAADHSLKAKWAADPHWKEYIGSAAGHDWGFSDGFWLALDYHIPLVTFGGREKWRPSSETLRLPWGCLRELPIRYDTWAGMAQVSSWLAVPVIVGSLVGLLRRRPGEVGPRG